MDFSPLSWIYDCPFTVFYVKMHFQKALKHLYSRQPINEKLPARGLCHPEEEGCLKSQHSYSHFWNTGPQGEEWGWSIHHCPGGWSVPVPPIKHLCHNVQANHSIIESLLK